MIKGTADQASPDIKPGLSPTGEHPFSLSSCSGEAPSSREGSSQATETYQATQAGPMTAGSRPKESRSSGRSETERTPVERALSPPATPASVAVSRLDLITGEWTIFAPNRTERPDEFHDETSTPAKSIDCPFCQGNEAETPDPVWVAGDLDLDSLSEDQGDYLLDHGATDWSVRVVPNRFPAVSAYPSAFELKSTRSASHGSPREGLGSRPFDANPIAGGHPASTVDRGLFQYHSSRGGHEVIIESPRHVQSINELDRGDAVLVFIAYRDRIRYWRQRAGIQYISVFKNVGRQAGASLSHCHSQLIATSHLPSSVAAVARTMSLHQARTGCCLQCDLIRGELKAKTRIVAKTDSLVAYCPFASRMPMELRITTVKHRDCFEDLPLTVIGELAQLVSRATSWLQSLHPGISYNYVLHTRPPGVQGADAQHWSLEIIPRLTRLAGFELGSQTMINPVLPERAANLYRERAAAEDPRQILG